MAYKEEISTGMYRDLEKEQPINEGNWERKKRELFKRIAIRMEQLRIEREAEDQEVTRNLVKKIQREEKEER